MKKDREPRRTIRRRQKRRRKLEPRARGFELGQAGVSVSFAGVR